MHDKRCKYKIRDCRDFYLFIKHKKSHIYYAKFPEYNKCVSTKQTDIRAAYKVAYQIYYSLGSEVNSFRKQLLDLYKDVSKKRYREVLRVLEYMPDVKTAEQVTLQRLVRLQDQMLESGLSGKSVNNNISLLRRLWKNKEYNPFVNLSPVKHNKEIRQSFIVSDFKNFGSHIFEHKYLVLPYIAITTGMRVGEFKTAEPVYYNDKLYLQINGTKTKYSVRKVPITEKVLAAYNFYKSNGYATRSWRQSVIMAASIIGCDEKYIEENNVVFHSFRKMFKTILESSNINNLWIEYFMGHSILQSNDVNKLYFNPQSADDTIVYEQVINAMKFLN